MKIKQILVIAGLAATLGGCYPTQYTHIEKVDDGYVLTKNQGGFFRVRGEVWKCTPEGDKTLRCTKTGQK